MPAIPITQNDIFFALAGAAAIFLVYKVISGAIRMFITRASVIHFDPEQLEGLLESCYHTFPIDNLDFKGATFRRGASVRITTTRKTIIEGQFVGANKAEMICLVTDNTIIAQEIGAILEMQDL